MLFFLCVTIMCLGGGCLCGYGLSQAYARRPKKSVADQRTVGTALPGGRTLLQQCKQQFGRLQQLLHQSLGRGMLVCAGLALVNLLYASFSMVANGVLRRIDPLIFTCGQMLCLLPVALFFLVRWRGLLTRVVVLRGMLFGGCLASGFVMMALALRAIGITESAMLTCLEGIVATGVSFCLFRQRLTTYTWIACLCALLGALSLWSAATMQWQGDFLAFLGGTHFLVYAFLVEHLLPQEPRERSHMLWPLFGVQFLTMSIVTTILALAFGRWQSLQLLVPGTDLTVMVYVGLGMVAIPVLLSTLLIRYAGAVTVAFFAVLEPLASGLFAYVVAGERLPLLAYAGSSGILLSMLLQAMGTIGKQAPEISAASPHTNE